MDDLNGSNEIIQDSILHILEQRLKLTKEELDALIILYIESDIV